METMVEIKTRLKIKLDTDESPVVPLQNWANGIWTSDGLRSELSAFSFYYWASRCCFCTTPAIVDTLTKVRFVNYNEEKA